MILEEEKSLQWMDLTNSTLQGIFLKELISIWEIYLAKEEGLQDFQWAVNQIFLLKFSHKWPLKELEDFKDSNEHSKEEDNKIIIYYFFIRLYLIRISLKF